MSRVASRSVSVVVSNGTTGGGVLSASLTAPSTGVANQVVSFHGDADRRNGPVHLFVVLGRLQFRRFQIGAGDGDPHLHVAGDLCDEGSRDRCGERPGDEVGHDHDLRYQPDAPGSNYTVTGADINPFNGTYEANAGALITLTASEEEASAYAWDFGDGTTGAGKSVTKYYNEVGSYDIRLVVTATARIRSGRRDRPAAS
jgi:hypothetical protein